MYWLFGILFSLDAHIPKPGWRGEGLGLPTGQGALPSLRTGGVEGKGVKILIGIIYKVIKKTVVTRKQ